MTQTTSIRVNHRALTLILVGGICALAGVFAGWGIFGWPRSSQGTVPADALKVARDGGQEILQGVSPDKLSVSSYTPRFAQQYAAQYSAFIRPASTKGSIGWTGTPVVTWSGGDYIDVAMAARTQAGIVMLELRLVHQNGGRWTIDQLLSIQLREPAL